MSSDKQAQSPDGIARARDTVRREAFFWGDDVSDTYFAAAEAAMDEQWADLITPVLRRHPIDYSVIMELSCGHGRNSAKLSPLAGRMILVDVNPDNIAFVRTRFDTARHRFVLNSGYDLADIADGEATFVYSFDSMVHFDAGLVALYVPEFARVLKPGGYGFIHHSNYSEGRALRDLPRRLKQRFYRALVLAMHGKERFPHLATASNSGFRANPHWRAINSRENFADLCRKAGLEVVEQTVIDWGGVRDLDCLTVFRRPAA